MADAERLVCNRRGRFGAFVRDQYDNQDDQRDGDRHSNRNCPAIATTLVIYGRRIATRRRRGRATRTGRRGRIATAGRRGWISRARCRIARAGGRRRQRWFACGTVTTLVQGRLPSCVTPTDNIKALRFATLESTLASVSDSTVTFTRDLPRLHKRRLIL